MPYKEKIIKKRYYTITDLSRELKVNSSLLRHYELEGIIKSDLRSKSDVRMYKPSNVERIRVVMKHQKTGWFSLKGLAEVYRNGKLPNLLNDKAENS